MKALRVFVSFILLFHVGSIPAEIGLDTTIGTETTGSSEGTTAGGTEAATEAGTGGTDGTGETGGTEGCTYFLKPILFLYRSYLDSVGTGGTGTMETWTTGTVS